MFHNLLLQFDHHLDLYSHKDQFLLILYWLKQTSQDLLLLVSLASPTLVLLCCLPSLVLLPLDNISLFRLAVLDYLLPQPVVFLPHPSRLEIS